MTFENSSTEKKLETQEAGEVFSSVESPEAFNPQIVKRFEEEIEVFQSESKKGLEEAENMALEEGLAIDGQDREELIALDQEAETVKAEFIAEIDDKNENIEKIPTIEQRQAFDSGKEMVLKLQASGNDKSPEYWALYSHLTEGLGADIQWRDVADIDAKKTEKMLTSKFSEKDQIVMRSCQKCGREYSRSNTSYCSACGAELELKQQEVGSEMKERIVKNPELLSRKEASKKLLAEERIKLAQEIREQRNAQSSRLSRLKSVIEIGQEKMEGEQGDQQFGRISKLQSAEADLMAKRLSSEELNMEEADDERRNLSKLIENSDRIKLLKGKIKEHYAKADEIAQRKFESVRKTVEQTLLRNNAFIVHTFLTDERLRHNDNSNISNSATLEDDMDILLSLEPSISTSSVKPGSRQGLWGGHIGVVLGGGDIRGIRQGDDGTTVEGIKNRNGSISSSQEIDENVSNIEDRGYNELVVNNPKVFGFFQNINVDEAGRMIGFSADRSDVENIERRNDFMKYIDLAKGKGMPPLIMTPDRRLFEFLSIDNNGVVSVGSEITPEQVATGNAGLLNEKRKEIGEEIISKHLFKNVEHHQEAKNIISEISEKEQVSELTEDEYVKQLEMYPEEFGIRLIKYPSHLLDDKSFMLKAAGLNPEEVLRVLNNKSSGKLLNDRDFIKSLYDSVPRGNGNIKILRQVPMELIDKELALIALEHGDDIGDFALPEQLFNDPDIKERLIRLCADNFSISPLDREEKVVGFPNIGFRKPSGEFVGYAINQDNTFLEIVKKKYAEIYKIEPSYDDLLVSKL